MPFKNVKFYFDQSGITLIISILMLSVVVFISFALSALIIREIRTVRVVLDTEPAIAGAEAGGELGLYQLLREKGGVDQNGSTPASGAGFEVTSDLYDNPFPFSLSDGEVYNIGLFDAENFNNLNADYGSVTISVDGGSNAVEVSVFNLPDASTPLCNFTVFAGGSSTCSALNQADDRYVVSLSANFGNTSGEITTTDNSGDAKGVPSDTPGIDIIGTSGDAQRRIQIELK